MSLWYCERCGKNHPQPVLWCPDFHVTIPRADLPRNRREVPRKIPEVSNPKPKSAGKVVMWARRQIGCARAFAPVEERSAAQQYVDEHNRYREIPYNDDGVRFELVRMTTEPWPPAPKPKPRRKQIVYGPKWLTRAEKESRAHRKNIRRTIKALEKKIK